MGPVEAFLLDECLEESNKELLESPMKVQNRLANFADGVEEIEDRLIELTQQSNFEQTALAQITEDLTQTRQEHFLVEEFRDEGE